jgi:hypothetical protein
VLLKVKQNGEYPEKQWRCLCGCCFGWRLAGRYGRASVLMTPKRFLDVDGLQQVLQLLTCGDE